MSARSRVTAILGGFAACLLSLPLVAYAQTGATISGIVTSDPANLPLADVYVSLESQTNGTYRSTGTNADGAFGFQNIAPGNYKLRFYRSGYVTEAYDNHLCGPNCIDAGDVIALTDGAVLTINASLTPAARISGMVGGPAPDALLQTRILVHNTDLSRFIADAYVQSTGEYIVDGLPPGSYIVHAWPPAPYTRQTYNGHDCPDPCYIWSGDIVTVGAGQTLSGIDFHLAGGSLPPTISGRVTEQLTGDPVPNVTVVVRDLMMGMIVAQAATAADGIYSAPIAPGQYRVQISSAPGFFLEAYNNIPCSGASCDSWLGDTVTGPAAGIDFALERAGAISGWVRDAGGAPVAMASVLVYDSMMGMFAGSTSVDMMTGEYTVGGLRAGTYRVFTSNTSGFVDEVFDDFPCGQSCYNVPGTSVVVSPPQTTGDINFTLARGQRILGTITAPDGGTIGYMTTVNALDPTGMIVKTTMPNLMTGAYEIGGLSPGQYRVQVNVSSDSPYTSQAYPNIICGYSCSSLAGDLLQLAAGSTLDHIDFALTRGASISGRVTDQDNGRGIPAISVSVYNDTGMQVSYGSTDPDGYYTVSRLGTGTYKAAVAFAAPYLSELWNNIPCVGYCSSYAGTPIVLTSASEQRTGIDFALERGGGITGTITLSHPEMMMMVGVNVYDATTMQWVGSATVDPIGHFSVGGLRNGAYRVQTYNALGYVNEAWNNVSCGSYCSPSAGDILTLAPGETKQNIDFFLQRGGSIAGVVTGPGGTPLPNATVIAVDSAGYSYSSITLPDGFYQIGSLAGGTYKVYTRNTSGLIDEVFDNVYCFGFCNPDAGTPVTVTPEQMTTANFALERGGTISGVVRDSDHRPIANASIAVIPAQGGPSQSGVTDASGAYFVGGLSSGTHFVRASAEGFVTQAYLGVSCSGTLCAQYSGTPVQVTRGENTSGIDFQMTTGGTITARLLDPDGASIAGVVYLFNSAGTFLGGMGQPSMDNPHTITGLPAGTYYLVGSSYTEYVSTVYGGSPCAVSSLMEAADVCNLFAGTPVTVIPGMTTGPLEIRLVRGGQIAGTIRGADGQASNIYVGAYDATGRHVSGTSSDPLTGTFTINSPPLAPGTYYLRTTNAAGLIDEVYDDVPCAGGNCAPALGTPIDIVGSEIVSGKNITLARGGSVSGRVTAAGGQPLAPGAIQIGLYDDHGKYVATALTDSDGNYSFSMGLPSGTYHAVASGYASPFVAELYGGLPCVGGCDVTAGAAIGVVAPDVTANINFDLELGAAITGRVTDAQTGAALTSANIVVYDHTGRTVTWAYGDVGGRYTTREGLPAGTYYLRASGPVGYVPQAYGGQTCLENCVVTGTTPVSVAQQDTATADFHLARGAVVSGRVTNTAGASLVNVNVNVIDQAGTLLTFATADSAGTYVMRDALPDGTYFARTSNAAGYRNQIFEGMSCLQSCLPSAGGTPLALTAGMFRSGVDFVLAHDEDVDGDGIADSIDLELNAYSDRFSDVRQGGSTAGRITARNGAALAVGDIPAGVRLSLDTAGTAPAIVDVCENADAGQLILDATGERAEFSCSSSGTVLARAVTALPVIELRKAPTGPATVIELRSGQSIQMGSPIAALTENTLPVRVRYVDASGITLGWFDLDPGERVDSQIIDGQARLEVLTGSVSLHLDGQPEPIVLEAGQSIQFSVDREAPTIGIITVDRGTLWPPEHQMVAVTVAVEAADDSGARPSCAVTDVTSNEPENGTGDGDTAPDFSLSGGMTVHLRAERAGTGGGRTYTLTIRCTDPAGNAATANTTVLVPRNQR